MNIKEISLLLLALIVTVVFSAPTYVASQGLQQVPPPAGTAGSDLPAAILSIINTFLVLAAITALIFLIIGGFRYIFSQGDDQQAGKAKNTILYSVIGLIVIGLAAAVVNFVVDAIAQS